MWCIDGHTILAGLCLVRVSRRWRCFSPQTIMLMFDLARLRFVFFFFAFSDLLCVLSRRSFHECVVVRHPSPASPPWVKICMFSKVSDRFSSKVQSCLVGVAIVRQIFSHHKHNTNLATTTTTKKHMKNNKEWKIHTVRMSNNEEPPEGYNVREIHRNTTFRHGREVNVVGRNCKLSLKIFVINRLAERRVYERVRCEMWDMRHTRLSAGISWLCNRLYVVTGEHTLRHILVNHSTFSPHFYVSLTLVICNLMSRAETLDIVESRKQRFDFRVNWDACRSDRVSGRVFEVPTTFGWTLSTNCGR